MHLLNVILAVVLAATASASLAQDYGKYVGTVQTEWLEDGRRMRLLAPFSYFDPAGQEWPAPSGWVVDGASIPQLAWSVIGGPFEGKYRSASVSHDVGCDQKARAWEAVHEVFYWAMLASEVEMWRAKVMYAAVYHFGPRWPRVVTIKGGERVQRAIAREKALMQANPGSKAEIVEIHSYGRKADFDIRVTPPPIRLAEQDFEVLKLNILRGEETRILLELMSEVGWASSALLGAGTVKSLDELKKVKVFSLDDIREFQPVDSP